MTNVSGSGFIRTSPTGPMPSTGASSSIIDIAIIALVCPPLRFNRGGKPVCHDGKVSS
jgi:hypothetical protein